MKISEIVLERIQSEYNHGMTQEEIARKYNIDQQRVNRILSGKRKVSGFTIATLERMFPRAVISLDGGSCVNASDSSVAIGDNTVSVNGNNFLPRNEHDDRIDRIQDAVMSSDLDSDAKCKVYAIIAENKK